MIKQKTINIADSNIALLGSDIEKNVKKHAAEGEPAWKGAGKAVGLEIWRVEQFKIHAWPKDQYGKFFSGDSYIILNTYTKKDDPKLYHDVHFWLGESTSQDEAGTAAYKTVELDDVLTTHAAQHREVQGHETELFLNYFKGHITIMQGGIESGFHHVKPEEYQPRLLHLKGRKSGQIRVTEVPLSRDSLNHAEVFVLDAGLILYQWDGKNCSPQAKFKGATIARSIEEERKGSKVVIIDDSKPDPNHHKKFWTLLGGEGAIKDSEPESEPVKLEKKLMELSEANGKLTFKEVASGANVKRSLLNSENVYIFDAGSEVYAWVGKKSTTGERKVALQYAHDYLVEHKRPIQTPISRVVEGGENHTFETAF